MSNRTVRRFVEGLLRGQRTEPARPDDFEAEQMKAAIELRAARLGSDAPREQFVTDDKAAEADVSVERKISVTRRQSVVAGEASGASAK